MSYLRYTLVTDGRSDQLLRRPIDWLLARLASRPFLGEWANPEVWDADSAGLQSKLAGALESYPCDLLFVHRDAEKEPRERRVEEIRAALATLRRDPPAVCVVPVRMTEAWLLIDEEALRRASGNPRGSMSLGVPRPSSLEEVADPKQLLFDLLKEASGLSGRRARRFRLPAARYRLAELIDDFSPLEKVAAFRTLAEDLRTTLEQNGWSRT